MLRIFLIFILLFPVSLGLYVTAKRAPAMTIHDVDCSKLLAYMLQKDKTQQIRQLLKWPGLSAELLGDQIDDRLLRSIQESYQNPKKLIGFHPRLKIDVSEIPLDLTTGDFWRIVRMSGSRVSFFVGDGAGHGIKPAIEGVRLHQFFDETDNLGRMVRQLPELDAHKTLQFIDERVSFLEPKMGLTNALLDLASGEMTFAKGGMPDDIIIKRAAGGVESLKSQGGYIGSLRADLSYSFTNNGGGRVKLLPGDMVIMMSDGISEANTVIAKDGSPIPNNLGDRLLDLIEGGSHDPAKLKREVLAQVRSKSDDITLLIFQWVP